MDKEEKKEKPKLRIGIFMAGLMIAVAGLFDLIQMGIELISVGFLGWIINPLFSFFACLTFFVWFGLKGVSYVKPGKAVTLGITTLLEFIPYVNDLPAWILGVIIVLAMVYAEDIVAKFSPKAAAALSTVLSGPKIGKLAKEVVT
ncbi:MAG: hypothetical protein WC385_02065 [Candidatus Paceibacterota bacterium]|jgi:hypothetical protein